MFKIAFLQKMSIISNPKTDFSLTSANKPQSFISASLKSIVNVELAAQIAGQI